MKIRVAVSDLKDVLKIASTVKPKTSSASVGGFLFTTSEGRCFVNSSSDEDYVRVELPVLSVEGEEPFVYPSDRVEAIQYMAGWVEIESGSEDKEHWFNYKTQEGSSAKVPSYDPKIFTTIDSWFGEAPTSDAVEFPTAVLKEALSMNLKYLSPERVADKPFNTVQIFDQSSPDWAKGDGTMYGADGTSRACYFYSQAFLGKGLAIHQKHIDYLRTFLSKCGKTVKLRRCSAMTFAIDQVPGDDGALRDGSIFGWLHHAKTHAKYSYYNLKNDQFILRTAREVVLRNLKWLRSEMPKNSTVIRVVYADKRLKFHDGGSLETATIDVVPQPLEEGGESGSEFSANVAIQAIIELFENVKGHEIDLRFGLVGKDQKDPVFRTIESFRLNDEGKLVITDGYECHVTCLTLGAGKNG